MYLWLFFFFLSAGVVVFFVVFFFSFNSSGKVGSWSQLEHMHLSSFRLDTSIITERCRVFFSLCLLGYCTALAVLSEPLV